MNTDAVEHNTRGQLAASIRRQRRSAAAYVSKTVKPVPPRTGDTDIFWPAALEVPHALVLPHNLRAVGRYFAGNIIANIHGHTLALYAGSVGDATQYAQRRRSLETSNAVPTPRSNSRPARYKSN